MKSISVIVPLYNEKPSLDELHAGLQKTLAELAADHEIIFVDDGSRDGSIDTLRDLQQQDSHIRVVRLRRNFGKSAALSAGFRIARGEIVVTLDADLQDQPCEMPRLLSRLDEGCDLVSGWKRPRRDSWTKRLASRLFNLITSWLTGVPLHDINCGFKAYRREVIEEIKVYGEMHRYIPVLASYRGFAVGEVQIAHRARRYGKSRYGVGRMWGGFLDLLTVIMLTRYSSKPLHVFGILGIVLLATGFVVEAYLSVGWFFGRWIGDRPAFMLGILLLIIGAQFIFFGLLAEMIAYSARRDDDCSIREISGSSPLDRQNAAGP
jgi:glycosyltransferase involved in cell wall biosynthesis